MGGPAALVAALLVACAGGGAGPGASGEWRPSEPLTVVVLPVVPVGPGQFLGGYTRTETYALRVLYAPRLERLRQSPTGPTLQAARRGLAEALRDRGYRVPPPHNTDPILRHYLRESWEKPLPELAELGRALDADAFLFAWSDQFERMEAVAGIQRSRFSLALHLVDARSGERLWVHEERRNSSYSVGDSDREYVTFVEEAARRMVSGIPSPARTADGERSESEAP